MSKFPKEKNLQSRILHQARLPFRTESDIGISQSKSKKVYNNTKTNLKEMLKSFVYIEEKQESIANGKS